MSIDYRTRRLDKTQARKLVLKILNRTPEKVRFSWHALKELTNDNLTTGDALNVLKSADARIIHEPDFENGSYRYRIGTRKIVIVVAFDSPESFVVVTGWRKTI